MKDEKKNLGSFGIWYWSKNKSRCMLLTSIKDTGVFHLGTIAFGALLIAICKILRVMIEMVERRLKQATMNNSQVNCNRYCKNGNFKYSGVENG